MLLLTPEFWPVLFLDGAREEKFNVGVKKLIILNIYNYRGLKNLFREPLRLFQNCFLKFC